MAEEKIKIIYKTIAAESISHIALYIEEKGYPETAEKFQTRLYQFGNSLGIFPDKYPICRHSYFSHRQYRCAVFEGTFIFIYKVSGDNLIIYNVIHGNRLQ